MIFLDDIYCDRGGKLEQFRWVKAPRSAELSQLIHTNAHRIGQYLQRQGLLVTESEQSYLVIQGNTRTPQELNEFHKGSPRSIQV